MNNRRILQRDITHFARKLGFHLVGFARPEVDKRTREYFLKWVKQAKHAGLWYLADKKRLALRFNPVNLMKDVKSIIVFGVSYKDNLFGKRVPSHKGYISVYALRRDYHSIIKDRLKEVVRFIKKTEPSFKGRVFVDTAPVLERYFAYKAGLGFIGKNNFLINPFLGGLIFIGEIFSSIEFEPTEPLNLSCAECSLCIDSCPTGALSEYSMDLNLCISYHTIENRKGVIPREVIDNMQNIIFGCDECALACPYNSQDIPDIEPFFGYENLECLQGLDLEKLLKISEEEFRETFKGTPVERVGYYTFMRNVIIASFNSNNRHLIEMARQKCKSLQEPVIRHTCMSLSLLD